VKHVDKKRKVIFQRCNLLSSNLYKCKRSEHISHSHSRLLLMMANKYEVREVARDRTQQDGDSKNEMNILLLGETGVGKSTFINAFINYLAHDTLDDATKDIACLIPSYFTVTDPQTFEEKKVSLGEFDPNEDHSTTKSATQFCKCYVFKIGDTVIKLIDTPGIGDTRGVESDGSNMRVTQAKQCARRNRVQILHSSVAVALGQISQPQHHLSVH